MGVILGEIPYSGSDNSPPVHTSNLVIYELHVRAFTARANSCVSIAKRGTFAGLIEKIPYLKDLGVTAVELMPVTQHDPQEGSCWGYMPLGLFAPHRSYASTDQAEEILSEFQAMGRGLSCSRN